VAGEGPLDAWLAREAPANLRRLGHLSDADLAGLRAHARVVVSPSLFYEHFGYAPAEAMLDRRAVVASRIGALPELVEHEVTGLLATAGDAEALAAAVRRALADPAAVAWGEQAGRGCSRSRPRAARRFARDLSRGGGMNGFGTGGEHEEGSRAPRFIGAAWMLVGPRRDGLASRRARAGLRPVAVLRPALALDRCSAAVVPVGATGAGAAGGLYYIRQRRRRLEEH
jgi:hypothetical protein